MKVTHYKYRFYIEIYGDDADYAPEDIDQLWHDLESWRVDPGDVILPIGKPELVTEEDETDVEELRRSFIS